MPGNRARHRTGAQDGRPALERLPVHRDGAVGGERALAHDHLHLAALEQSGQPAVQLLDDAGLAGVRRRPVRLGHDAVRQFHAVRAGVVHGAEDLGGVQQRLGRDAAAVQAGAADLLLLHQRHRQAGGRGVQRGGVAAGTAAEDDDVVVGHDPGPPVVWCENGCGAAHQALATFRMASAISAGCGITASSSGGLVGRRGVLRADPLDRLVQVPEGLLLDRRGDLRAVPHPHGRLVQHHRPRRLLHGVDDRLDVQRYQRPDVDDLDRDAFLVKLFGDLQALVHAGRVGDQGDVAAFPDHLGHPERDRIHGDRAGGLEPPVEVLVLQVQRRVVVPDRRDQQPGSIFRRPRHHDLDAGHVREVALHALRVAGPGPQPAAEGCPHRHRHRVAGPVVVLGQHVDDRVERAGDEVGELVLDHRPQPDQRGTGGQAGEPGLGDGGVHHPQRPELVQETLGHLEGAAVLADVLADEEDVGITIHLVIQRQTHRLQIRRLTRVSRHKRPPRPCSGPASDLRAPACARRWRTAARPS